MAYQKLNWLNKGETGAIPINKDNLNHMDNGIANNDSAIGNLANLNTSVKDNLVNAINSVVETGTNNNGTYIKFADGTMIITQSFTRNIAVTTKDTGTYVYYGSVNEEDIPSYPQTFTSILSANINIFDNYCMCGTGTQGGAGLSKISTKLYVYSPASVTRTVQFYVSVIGKWK